MIITFGTAKPDFALRCWKSQSRYAERCGVDFRHIMIAPKIFPNQDKLDIITKYGSGRVLYLDWDVELSNDAENVFNRDDRMLMFPRQKNYAEPKEWANTGMMLGEHSDFLKMKEHFTGFLSRQQRDNYLREENAIYQSAIAADILITQDTPKGFIHLLGQSKWGKNYAPTTY